MAGVSDEYVDRLKRWADENCARCASGADDGVNAFSRETMTRLEKYGLKGFHGGQISRWRRRDVKVEVSASTLTRLGLLQRFSTDPNEAKRLTRAWLEGTLDDRGNEILDEPSAWRGVEAIPYGDLTADELVNVVTHAAKHLGQLASASSVETEAEPPAPVPNAATHLLLGKMQTARLDVSGLAVELGIEVARAAQILEGYLMTAKECEAAARFTEMPVDAICQWGGLHACAPVSESATGEA